MLQICNARSKRVIKEVVVRADDTHGIRTAILLWASKGNYSFRLVSDTEKVLVRGKLEAVAVWIGQELVLQLLQGGRGTLKTSGSTLPTAA